ncbi:YesK family protein [Paenibacillus sambharensis]|uniref:YesK family protein n=1 Tax=Paenibacillus sambharensis TaxID=1803190 RepID=UPI0015E8D781|nr:YesK family protein [Paenibacillus sambharensis]
MAEIALLFAGILFLLLVLSYTLKRLVPGTRPAVYAPSVLTLLLSIAVLLYSFAIGGFEGMGLGVAALTAGLASIIAGLVTTVADIAVSRNEEEP